MLAATGLVDTTTLKQVSSPRLSEVRRQMDAPQTEGNGHQQCLPLQAPPLAVRVAEEDKFVDLPELRP